LLTRWINAQVKRTIHAIQVDSIVAWWCRLSPKRFKCNVNVSFFNFLDRVGVGVCIRDDQGAFVLAQTRWFSPMLDVDIGEALGLLNVWNG